MINLYLLRRDLGRRQRYTDNENPELKSWVLYERILGLDPEIPNDLIASMLFSIVFLVLLGGCFAVWRHRPYRCFSIYILGAGCMITFLGFAVRAGISNSVNPSYVSYIAECVFFIIGELCILDVWVMRARDELVDGLAERQGLDLQAHESPRTWLLAAKHSWETRVALASRVLLIPLSLILYLAGFGSIPKPLDENFNRHLSLKIRGVASFLPIVILAIMEIVLVMKACLYTQPWLPILLLFLASVHLWIPALYAFCLVSVTSDSADLIRSKTFFHAGFGYGQAFCVIILLLLTRRPALWAYHPPTDAEPPPPIKRYAYVPPRWVLSRNPQGGPEKAEAA